MKLASFNLYNYAKPGNYWYERKERNTFTPEQWQQKKQWVRTQLSNMNADVIGFQEVFSVKDLQQLTYESGYVYFETVAAPGRDIEDTAILTQPVIAIASRLPIKSASTITIAPEIKQALLLGDHFAFSRSPIHTIVETAEFGEVHVYVAHLKSKRPLFDDRLYSDDESWGFRVADVMQKLSRGHIASLLQPAALYHDACKRLLNNPNLPIIILGDLNDDESSTPFAALTMQQRLYEIGQQDMSQWPESVKGLPYSFRLYDSFTLAPPSFISPVLSRQSFAKQADAQLHSTHSTSTPTNNIRPYTYVYKGKDIVLDYALVSNSFNKKNPHHLGYVAAFNVLNGHLKSDEIANPLQSDHGQAVITLKPKNTPLAPMPDVPSNELNRITRKEFIELAGGTYHSDEKYDHWGQDDKWRHFWSFFFDNDRGYIKSVYGAVPVELLLQKQRHSIEHIIPQAFLNTYLKNKNAPKKMRYGAGVNPLNFIPAERSLNSSRSSFPFDFDGDEVKRPFRISLNPDAYLTTGLDAGNEWVIPSRSRGDIARAILYMLITYGIDELYNNHLETLIHWAKIDAPSDWEIAYNQWVYNRLNIHNPFIDSKENILALLSNTELMSSIILRV